jgi:integrase
MLARCGMRINEPLRLRQEHYRADEGSVYIQKTKFRKDRLIPVPKAVLTQIENYRAVRRALCPEDQNPYLLAGKRRGPIKDYHIRDTFHITVKNIKLSQPKQVIGNITFGKPLPHSLRHYAEFRIMPSNIPQPGGSLAIWLILLGIIRDF